MLCELTALGFVTRPHCSAMAVARSSACCGYMVPRDLDMCRITIASVEEVPGSAEWGERDEYCSTVEDRV